MPPFKIEIELADEEHLLAYLRGLHLQRKRLPVTLDLGRGTIIRISEVP